MIYGFAGFALVLTVLFWCMKQIERPVALILVLIELAILFPGIDLLWPHHK